MTEFAVITKIGNGNYACGEILIDPDANKCIAGSNIIVNPPHFDEKLFAEAIMFRDQTTIDLAKKQMLFCNTPVFTLGEILIIGSNDRTIPDGRKPSKWDVGCEYFSDIESAIKRAKEVVGDNYD
jgi:hypothetical protein